MFGVYSFVVVQTCQGLLTLGSLVMYFQAVQRASGFLEGLGWSGVCQASMKVICFYPRWMSFLECSPVCRSRHIRNKFPDLLRKV